MSRMTHPGRSLTHIHKFVYLFSCVVSYSQAYLRSYFNLSSISSLCYSIAFLWNQMVALWFSVFLHLSIRCIAVVLILATFYHGTSGPWCFTQPQSKYPLLGPTSHERETKKMLWLYSAMRHSITGFGRHWLPCTGQRTRYNKHLACH